MNSRQNNNAENLRTDIVIIGAGGAGLAAAAAAAEKGATVILIEKRGSPGGHSAMAEGFFAAESPAQKRMGIDASRDKLFNIAMDFAHWKINPRIVRTFINKSGDTVRWLEAKGLEIYRLSPNLPGVMRTIHQPKRGGAEVIKLLVKACEELGVRLFCKTAAKSILTTATGKMMEVLAMTKENELRITARSVIIATGGYAANKELLKQYCPSYTEDIRYPGLPHLTGDGLLMATEIGAATEGLGMLHMSGPYLSGPYFEASRLRANIFCTEPNTIWVNKKGERFIDETVGFQMFESVNAVIQQTGKVSYTIFDEQIKRNVIESGPIKASEGVFYGLKKADLAKLAKDLLLHADKGAVKISDSWDEIARWIGVAPEVLKATIDEYNACCEQGYDDIFTKDRRYLVPLRIPPYYAMICRVRILGTIGGIKINHHMEVLNLQDNPIPGLYAVGNDAGGWEPDTYNWRLLGNAFGFALNSGRIAGENAAQYVSG